MNFLAGSKISTPMIFQAYYPDWDFIFFNPSINSTQLYFQCRPMLTYFPSIQYQLASFVIVCSCFFPSGPVCPHLAHFSPISASLALFGPVQCLLAMVAIFGPFGPIWRCLPCWALYALYEREREIDTAKPYWQTQSYCQRKKEYSFMLPSSFLILPP